MVPYWAICVFYILLDDVKFGWFIIFGCFYSVPQHSGIFNTIWKAGNSRVCIYVLTYPLFITNLDILFTMTAKKILLSTLSKEISGNWSSFLESFSFGMWIPSANPQLSAINFFLWNSRKSFQNSVDIFGHFCIYIYIYIYILYIYIYIYINFNLKHFTCLARLMICDKRNQFVDQKNIYLLSQGWEISRRN